MVESLAKLAKALRLLARPALRAPLFKGVAATIEHIPAFRGRTFRTVIDIGANRGQFVLLMAELFPQASIFAFEPLPQPFAKMKQVTRHLPQVVAHNVAIGPIRSRRRIYISKRDDSSSLLPITPFQEEIFPHTGLARTDEVEVRLLEDLIPPLSSLAAPSLLKIDVQGFEGEVLFGCDPFLDLVDAAYVESSFVQLYEGQSFADEIIDRLHARGLRLAGIYNLSHAASGEAVQADFLFVRCQGQRKTASAG